MKLRRPHLRQVLWAVIPLLLAASGALAYWILRPMPLPYHDSFAQHRAEEWVPIGGAWHLEDGAIYNRSDERGAKLMTGSDSWKNYALTADIKVVGDIGDSGLIVRARNVDIGTDSYNGYYIGLRSADSALVIGRADYGWMEARPTSIPGGVLKNHWYRLRVIAVGCSIGVEATSLATGQGAWAAFEEHLCVPSGQVGLRSMMTGGIWRNISVVPATTADYEAIRAHAGFVGHPDYPIREDDYNRMREDAFSLLYQPDNRSTQPEGITGSNEATVTQLTPIGEARVTQNQDMPVTIRGVVTLTSPLYVQDATGGIGVDRQQGMDLNAGDEVEMTGHLETVSAMPRFIATSAHLLGDHTPAVPSSISSTQAASGAFDSMLVEVRGVLRKKSMDRNGAIHLQLSDDAQSFEAVMESGLSQRSYEQWEPGSELRVYGVCVVRSPDGQRDNAFTLLLRSTDDVAVISGAPWWTGRNVVRLILLAVLLMALGVYLVLRLERWKAAAILNERERLAHEMHDTLAQSFAGVGFHLQGMRNSFRGGTQPHEAMLEKLDVVCSMVTTTHRDASASIAALHPDAEEGKDLLVALERITMAMLDGNALPMDLVREGTPRTMSMPVRDALFQIGREAITNVLRHSQATQMVLRLRYESKWVVLEISDNGAGFEYEPRAQDFGLKSIRARCERVGARLAIRTAPGQGTTLSVRAPYGLRLGLGDWLHAMRLRLRSRTQG